MTALKLMILLLFLNEGKVPHPTHQVIVQAGVIQP
jgi:hypothetical protein